MTLCDYDARKSPLASLSAANKLRYARKHGYSLYVETRSYSGDTRPPAWSKVGVVSWVSPPVHPSRADRAVGRVLPGFLASCWGMDHMVHTLVMAGVAVVVVV